MARTEAFDRYSAAYEAWFEEHRALYDAEVEAIRALLPHFGSGVEIGVGSGRFSLPFGITLGIEPSKKMAEIALSRGIDVIEGVAERLPLPSESFDLALMVTTICFVDDPLAALQEANRILRPGGTLIIGFVDRASALGRLYERKREKSRFYKEATFFTTHEIIHLLEETGFHNFAFRQTLFGDSLEQMDTSVKEGYGEGAFVALRAKKGRHA
jgi:SAM-dependent methyltransferase